jgi:hypothetical protein
LFGVHSEGEQSMSGKHVLAGTASLILLLTALHYARDPLHTQLPFGTTDLQSVQPALSRLRAADRAMVEAYVKRSNGDRLPEKMADPESPFTARNFGEAIALQKKWEEKTRGQAAAASTEASAHEASMEDLRDAVAVRVARREIVPLTQATQPLGTGKPKLASYSADYNVFVAGITVFNHANSEIVELKGAVKARDKQTHQTLDICQLDDHHRIPASGDFEVRCGKGSNEATADDEAFVADAPGRFQIVWEPRLVRYADGKVLESKP